VAVGLLSYQFDHTGDALVEIPANPRVDERFFAFVDGVEQIHRFVPICLRQYVTMAVMAEPHSQ
jgi:hypothetical protein